MSLVTHHRCDHCGKLAEANDVDDSGMRVPRGWRVLDLPFSVGPREAVLEACSPGCAKALLNLNVDAEWELAASAEAAA